MLTRNDRQEGLSRAYVRAIAAQAGLIVSEPESDYGIDMSLRSVTLRGNRRRDLGPQVDLQLKSTTRTGAGDGRIVYDLDAVNYEDLRQPVKVARLLVLFVMPRDEGEWLSQSGDELCLRHCAYWLSLKGLPAVTSSSTVRVTVPASNVFSVDAVVAILKRLGQGRDV